MGRSPVLATESVTVLRPALSSISPSLMKSSPGIMSGTSYCPASSWPGLPRPSTSSRTFRKAWMPGSSPGMTALMVVRNLPDRFMHGDELRAIRKRRLDLDVMDHLGDAGHH